MLQLRKTQATLQMMQHQCALFSHLPDNAALPQRSTMAGSAAAPQ
jgi:hypothetical protein